MPESDLVLLHPPSVYDFRRETILYGPVSDLVPSSSVFEMYPVGFMSIAEYLERAGYRVRIVNLAVLMLNNKNFNPEALIKRLRAPVFGIDLHWLVHSDGAVEVAKIVKRCHPQAKVVMGGLSASYYYKQLLQYPEIDYVLRGDSTEQPFRQLMDCITNGREPSAVPNLVWRSSGGRTRENPFSHVPADFSDVMVGCYANTLRSVIKYRDLAGYIPFKHWSRYPITAVLTCRGCTSNCVVCGGSADAFRQFYNRRKPAFRCPEAVAEDVKQIERFSSGPVFILGDLRQPGEDWARRLLHLLRKNRVKNQLILELFSPVPRDLLQQMSLSAPGFCLEISPESHDPRIRKAAGRHYSNQALEQTIGDALDVGCGRLDVFFMIGLTGQTPKSVMETIDYCGFLLEKFKADIRLSLFIAPLAPFLDPGSIAFEQPKRHGYRILFRTFQQHRQALLAPSWKYRLNYETEWMTRQQIVDTTYEAILRLNRLKAKYGIISKASAVAAKRHIEASRNMVHRIDDLLSAGGYRQLSSLKSEVDRINMASAGEKTQLELPVGLVKLKPWSALRLWAAKR